MNLRTVKAISYQKNPLVTMKDVEEVRLRLKKQTVIEAPPSPPSLSSPFPSSFSCPTRYVEKSHLRTGLILALKDHLTKRDGLIRDAMDEFCKKYNKGSLLPNIYEKLGPISVKTLYRFKKKLEENGVDALVPQYGGVSKSKVTDHEKNFLLAILLHQNRLKPGFAIKVLKNRFREIGLESPSSADTLRRFVNQFQVEHADLWTLFREGEKALDDKFLPYIERDRNLLEVGDCLVADGHRLNLQVINPFTGLPCRPVVVFFYDWRSNFPCGWEIMMEESTQCIASAARNAILTLGKIPKAIYVDNGKAFKSRFFTSNVNLIDDEIAGMFYRLEGLKGVCFAKPYNAKAKPIERYFRTFTDWFERTWESYIGSSINDRPAWTKRNEKLARSLHSDRVPEISEVNEALFNFIEFFVDQPSRGLGNQTPREIFNAGKGSGIDPFKLHYLMMERKITTIHRNGFTLFGCNWYDEALYGYRDQVVVKYSLFNLSQMYVFNMKNEFLCAVKPISKTHPLASILGIPKDVEEVKRQIAHNRKLKRDTVNLFRRIGHKASEMFPWKEIVQEVPNVVEALEKIESEKPRPKSILPFIKEEAEGVEDLIHDDKEDEKFIIVDPRSGLSKPANGKPFESRLERYEWYRTIEKKYPGTLNDSDWQEIEEFETTEEDWKRFFSHRADGHIIRAANSEIENETVIDGGTNERSICNGP
jgi:putative transposase